MAVDEELKGYKIGFKKFKEERGRETAAEGVGSE